MSHPKSEALDYILFVVIHNLSYLIDLESAYALLRPIFEDRGYMINRTFTADIIDLAHQYIQVVSFYNNPQSTEQFIQAVKEHILADKMPELQLRNYVVLNNFYQTTLKITHNLVHGEYEDLNDIRAYRQKTIYTALTDLNKDLVQLIHKYDIYLFGKVSSSFKLDGTSPEVAIMTDGQIAVCAQNDNIKLIDPTTNSISVLDKDFEGGDLLVSLPNNRLFANSDGGTVFDTLGMLFHVNDQINGKDQVAFFPDGRLVLPSVDGIFEVVEPINGEVIVTIPAEDIEADDDDDRADQEHDNNVTCLATWGTNHVLVGFNNAIPKIFNLQDQKSHTLGTQVMSMCRFEILSDERFLGISRTSLTIWDWNQDTYDVDQHIDIPKGNIIETIVLSAIHIATVSSDQTLRIWDIRTGSLKFSLVLQGLRIGHMVRWNDSLVLASSNAAHLLLFNVNTYQTRILQEGISNVNIKGITVSRNRLVVAHNDGVVKLFE